MPHLPTECICGASFTVDHAFICPHGDFPTLCHNEIRDITAQLMSEVCPNVASEPTLKPITNERFFHRSANPESGARLDVRAGSSPSTSLRVFNPLATSNRQTTINLYMFQIP